ncbi:hypothetical protein MMC32_008242 [Xylographa parallela]|nr:hypothetical protein [Xylographa parallela]
MSVTPRIVTQMLRLSSVDPYDLPKHESGDSDTGGTLQPLMQFAPRRTIVHSTKDHAIGQLKSIDESVYRRQYRYLKRCYQGIAQESIVTNTLGLNDGAITTDLRLSTDREGNSQPPATARRYRGLLNCTNPIAAPQISPLSPIPTTRPKPGSLAPSSKCDASYFSIRYCGVSNPDRLAMPSTNPRHRRTASSGTTVFTPPLIATASPKSEKSGTAQSSSSDSSGWSKEQMSFL